MDYFSMPQIPIAVPPPSYYYYHNEADAQHGYVPNQPSDLQMPMYPAAHSEQFFFPKQMEAAAAATAAAHQQQFFASAPPHAMRHPTSTPSATSTIDDGDMSLTPTHPHVDNATLTPTASPQTSRPSRSSLVRNVGHAPMFLPLNTRFNGLPTRESDLHDGFPATPTLSTTSG
ncbi:hypothetical protein KEM56_000039, partial [Ascosphaera pollenicola]